MSDDGLTVLKSLEERLQASQRENEEALGFLRALLTGRAEPAAAAEGAPAAPQSTIADTFAKDRELLDAMDRFSDMVEQNCQRWDEILAELEASRTRLDPARR